MSFLLIIAASFLCRFAHAEKVYIVTPDQKWIGVTHGSSRPWQQQDPVCVFHQRNRVACGKVGNVIAKGAFVQITSHQAAITQGDQVYLAMAATGSMNDASGMFPATQAKSSKPGGDTWSVGAGVTIGTDFYFPTLNIQFAFHRHFALGLVPYLLDSSENGLGVRIIGGLATLDYYPAERLRGLWFQLGGGIERYQIQYNGASEGTGSLVGLATIGWRARWDFGLNAGAALGTLYMGNVTTTLVNTTSPGAHPILMTDVGISF